MGRDLIGELFIRFGADTAPMQRQMADFNRQLDRTGRSMESMGARTMSFARRNEQALTRVGMAAAAVGAAMLLMSTNAGKAATQFEATTTRMVSLVGLAQSEVDSLAESALNLGHTGRGPQELAEAMFFVTSAGLRGAEALQATEAAAKAASIGLGDTKTVADLASSAMNAYGADTLSASAATDVLIGAVREGKAEAPELAGAMGRILPIASEMGVRFDEVGAATAAMTRTGSDAATSTTQLRAILTSLLKPAAQSEEAMHALGLSSAELRDTIREDGLFAALSQLRDSIGDNEAALGQIFPNVRAMAGFLDLMGANAAETEQIFARMADTTGLTEEAFDTWSQTAEASFARFRASMEALKIEAGEGVAPILAGLADVGAGLAGAFGALPGPIRATGAAVMFLSGAVMLLGGTTAMLLPRIATMTAGLSAMGLTATTLGGTLRSLALFMSRIAGPVGLVVGAFWAWQKAAAAVDESVSNLNATLVDSDSDPRMALRGLREEFDRIGQSGNFGEDVGRALRQMIGGITLGHERAEIFRETVDTMGETSGQAALDLIDMAEAAGLVRREADGSISALSHMGDATALTAMEVVNLGAAAEKQRREANKAANANAEFGGAMAMTGADAEAMAGSMAEAQTATEDLSRLMEAHKTVVEGLGAPLSIYQQALSDKNDAERAAYEVTATAMRESGSEVAAFTASANLSLNEFASAMEQRNSDIINANANFLTVTRRFGADVTATLMEMGEEGIRLAGEMATGTDTEGQRMAAAMRKNAELTRTWTMAEIDELAEAMEKTMGEGGTNSANALARELGIGVEKVLEIAEGFGIALTEGINPIIASIGGEEVAVPRARRDFLNRMGITTRNTGGPIPGGGPDRDSVLIGATPGEHMWTRREVQAAGGHEAVRAMRRAVLEFRGRDLGGDPSDPIPPFQMLNVGGAVAGSAQWARAQAGKPYLWGGVGPRGYDCSGFVSAVQNHLLGRNPHSRLYATGSFAGGRPVAGLRPGLNSAFTVGVATPGQVPGSRIGHMSATIAGMNIEATPPRVRVGPGARGADNSLYRYRFHLPQVGGAFVGGGGGGAGGFVPAFDLPPIPDTPSGAFGDTATTSMEFTRDRVQEWLTTQIADAGGVLAPGWNLVGNGTGGNEAIVAQGMIRREIEHALKGIHGIEALRIALAVEGIGGDLGARSATDAIALIERLTDAWETAQRQAREAEERSRLAAEVEEARAAFEAADAEDRVRLHDEWAQSIRRLEAADRSRREGEAQRRIQAELARLETERQIAANREAWEFDKKSTADQLMLIEQKLAAERRYTDEWMRLARQRQQLAEELQRAATARVDDLNRLLDERQSLLDRMADAEARHASQVQDAHARHADAMRAAQERANSAREAAARQLADRLAQIERQAADERQRIIESREQALVSFFSPESRLVRTFANSISAVTRNVEDQLAAFAQWSQGLDNLRSMGLSEEAIAAMGLETASAQSLATVQGWASATEEEISAANEAFAQMNEAAATQAGDEAARMLGAVGDALTETARRAAEETARVQSDHAERLAAINEEFHAATARAREELNDRLAELDDDLQTQLDEMTDALGQIGLDQGRTYAEAIAEGIASGLPGILAAVQAAQDAMAGAGTVTPGPNMSAGELRAYARQIGWDDDLSVLAQRIRTQGFDRGGWLPPHSTTLAVNNTPRWEPVGAGTHMAGGQQIEITIDARGAEPGVEHRIRAAVQDALNQTAAKVRQKVG